MRVITHKPFTCAAVGCGTQLRHGGSEPQLRGVQLLQRSIQSQRGIGSQAVCNTALTPPYNTLTIN